MKTYANMMIASLLALGSLNAMAEVKGDAVVNSPVVTSLATLLNQKHKNACHVPEAKDVQWRCLGALMPVDKPTMESSGCFFSVAIACPGETAELSGMSQYYILVDQTDKVLATTPATIVFSQVTIK